MTLIKVKSSVKTRRIHAHSHVKGLGLDDKGEAQKVSPNSSRGFHFCGFYSKPTFVACIQTCFASIQTCLDAFIQNLF